MKTNRREELRDGVSDAPFLLDTTAVYYWFKYPYQRFHLTLSDRPQRAAVSFGLGVIEFAVGLIIAAIGGFFVLYVTSPGVYILTAGFIFFMGRAEWLWLEMFELIKHVREVFLVSDEEFKAATTDLGRRMTRLSIMLPLTVVTMLLAWAAIATLLYAPTSLIGGYLALLEPASFPHAWFIGSHRFEKMLVLDWYCAVAIFFTINVAFGTVATMVGIPGLVTKWSVVPVPEYISTRMARGVTFLLTGAVYYAIAVFLLVVFFGGQPSLPFVGIITVFVAIGLLVAMTPFLVIGRLVDRAKLQVTSAVSEIYGHEVFPLAAGNANGRAEYSERQRLRALAKLLRLQEVMRSANSSSSGIEKQVAALVPAVLTQGLPYLGFLVSSLLRQLHGM